MYMKVLKIIGSYIIKFLKDCFSSFFLVFAFYMALKEFEIVDSLQVLLHPLVISCAWSVFKLIFTISTKKNIKIKKWLFRKEEKFYLAYIILVLFFVSIKKDPIWDGTEVKDVISLQWTIFGISITVFLFWHVWFTGHLKSIEPKKSENGGLLNTYDYLQSKKAVNRYLESTYSAVIYLLLNMLILMISSALVYVMDKGENTYAQITILFSMYLCTNTLGALFMDVLSPITEAKENFHIKYNFSKEDQLLENLIVEKVHGITNEAMKIREDSSLTDQEQAEKLLELVEPLLGKDKEE